MIPKEVFLSHSSEDAADIQNIAAVMRAHGVPVWHSDDNIRGADEWHDEIGRALRRCDWFIVFLSKAAVASEWVKRELTYALKHSQYKGHILPVIIERCDPEDLSWTLGNFQMVSLFKNNRKKGFTALFQVWGIGYDPEKKA